MEERIGVISACRYVDKVIANAPLVPDAAYMEKEGITLIVHGDDFTQNIVEKYYGDAIKMGKFKAFPYTQGLNRSFAEYNSLYFELTMK